ncbi:MAG: IPT/TIG domain-containing protein [bacterium]
MRHRLPTLLSLTALVLGVALASPVAAAPAIWNFTKINPTTGPWGTKVRLRGYGFDKSAKVYYDGQLIKPILLGQNVILVQVPPNTQSGWFEISMGDRQLRAPVLFRVVNKPAVTGLSPQSGPPGLWVTVRGVHFDHSLRFWIGRSPVRRQFVNHTTYKLLIHRGLKSGPLFWAPDQHKRRTKFQFKIANYPVISEFTPKKGYYGDRVTLQGASFCPQAKVYLGGQLLKVIRRQRDRSLEAQLPKGVSTGRFEVECFGKRVTHADEFLVEPPFAEVTGITPSAGKAARWITVIGMGFARKDRFWMGNRALKVRLVSAREVKVFIPAGSRTAPIYFQSYGKRFKSSFSYMIYRPPVITGFVPATAWFGQLVTIRGRNFCPMVKVRLGAQNLAVIRREDHTQLVVQVPQGAKAGKFSVRCLTWQATSRLRLRMQAPKAGVRGVNPTEGPPGTRLEITGFNLRPSDRFYLGKVRLPMAFESGTQVSVTLPSTVKSGVLVHQSFGQRTQTGFRIQVGWPKPVFQGFTPKVAWYNEVVTLKGTKICDGPIVRLGGRVVPVVNSSGRSIEITVPAGSKGGVFQVQCHNHKVSVGGRLRLEAPYAQITSIYPKSGPWGTWLTLTGKNFRKRDRFWIGRVQLTDVRRISDNEVRVKVPMRAGTGKIAVLSRGRRVVTAHLFKLAFPVPIVLRVKPNEGWWGDYVTIHGRNFCTKPVVRFGKRVTFDLLRLDDLRIKVRVPKASYTGTVEVRCYGKFGRAPKDFKISRPKPRIVDVFPDRGPPLKWITITGRNLNRLSKIWLNHRKHGRVELVLKVLSDTKVQAYVPAGCKGGALEIMAYGRLMTTSYSYIVPRKYR